jgi:hypothetical protein
MSRPWTPDRLSEQAWRVLELARDGRALDHDLDGNRVLWGGRLQVVLNLQHRGLIDAAGKITPAGLEAFAPRPIKKRADNRNRFRLDRCFACASRSCYLRCYANDGSFDEVACREHESALRERVAQLNDETVIAEESEFKLKRAPKAKMARVWSPPE